MRMARVTTSVPYQVRCSYSAKQLVSEVGTWEKMCLEHVLEKWSCIGAERGRSGRPHQPHKCKKKRDFSAIQYTAPHTLQLHYFSRQAAYYLVQ